MGIYQCAVFSGEEEILSTEGYIQLEGISLLLKIHCSERQFHVVNWSPDCWHVCSGLGRDYTSRLLYSALMIYVIIFLSPPGLPHFSVEPQHLSVMANEELSLRCVAHGPPDPVRVIWLQDGAPLNDLDDPMSLSPSTLNISGTDRTLHDCMLGIF